MKKIAILFGALWIMSCSKDSDGNNNSIIGEWDYVAYIVQGQYNESDACGKNAYIVFTETNIVSASYNTTNGICTADVRRNTYTLSGDKLIFSAGGNSREVTYSISGDELRLNYLNDNTQQTTSIYKRRKELLIGNWNLKIVKEGNVTIDVMDSGVACFKNSTLMITNKNFEFKVSVPKVQGSTECTNTTSRGEWFRRDRKYYILENGVEKEMVFLFSDDGKILQFDYPTDNTIMTFIFHRQ